MRTYTFTIYFVGAGQEVVTAGCPTDAVILACAERIKKGLHRMGYQIQNNDTKEMWGLTGTNTLKVNYIK